MSGHDLHIQHRWLEAARHRTHCLTHATGTHILGHLFMSLTHSYPDLRGKGKTVALKINQPININPTLSGRRWREVRVRVSVSPWKLGCWTEKVGSKTRLVLK